MEQTLEICGAYVVGCCPYEAFRVGSLTKKCPYTHDEACRKSYASGTLSPAYMVSALRTYRKIISDVDKKAQQNRQCIELCSEPEDILNALEYAGQLIDQQSLKACDTEGVYALLRIHGAILEKAATPAKQLKCVVCRNCGALNKTSTCQHAFCQKYLKIRALIKDLEKRCPGQ